MNFRAQSTFTPADISRTMQKIVPKLVAATTDACGVVVEAAQEAAPYKSGDLHDGIQIGSVELVGTTVQGYVESTSDHAGFVEFGTGVRGEGTYPYQLPESGVPVTGSWRYDYRQQGWTGHAAQPYLRPALDTARAEVLAAYEKQGFKVK